MNKGKLTIAVFMLSAACLLVATPLASAKPNSPSWVAATPDPNALIAHIKWSPVSSADHYLLYRTENLSSPGILLGGFITSTSFDDTAVMAGKHYWYRVVAIDPTDPFGQQSAPTTSNQVTITTPSPPGLGGGPGGSSGSGSGGGSGGSSGSGSGSGSSPSAPSGLFPIVQCGNEGQPPCTLCDIFETLSRVLNILIIFTFAIGGLFLVVSGILMYFGGSKPGLLAKAKSMLTSVIIGIIIVLVSYLIVFSIIHLLSGGNADTYFNIKNGGFVIDCQP